MVVEVDDPELALVPLGTSAVNVSDPEPLDRLVGAVDVEVEALEPATVLLGASGLFVEVVGSALEGAELDGPDLALAMATCTGPVP